MIIRFWLLTAISCGLGVALFYSEWLAATGGGMSRDPALEPLSAGAPVLVAGGGVTGRAVLAALERLGATATLCDDDATTRQQFADAGTPTVDSATAAAARRRLRAGRGQPRFRADRAGARCRRGRRRPGLG